MWIIQWRKQESEKWTNFYYPVQSYKEALIKLSVERQHGVPKGFEYRLAKLEALND